MSGRFRVKNREKSRVGRESGEVGRGEVTRHDRSYSVSESVCVGLRGCYVIDLTEVRMFSISLLIINHRCLLIREIKVNNPIARPANDCSLTHVPYCKSVSD